MGRALPVEKGVDQLESLELKGHRKEALFKLKICMF
jgi:hypothetical protein